jgi:hypothetical protein
MGATKTSADATMGFDFAPLIRALIASQPISAARAVELIEEYQRYICLVADTQLCLPMASPVIDKVWHLHLSMPSDYTRMCEALGVFIEHRTGDDHENIGDFESLYRCRFGDLGSDWRDPTNGKPYGRCLCVATIRPYIH